MVPIDYQGNALPEAFVFGDIAGSNAAKVGAASSTLSHQDSEIALSRVLTDLIQPAGGNVTSHNQNSRNLLHAFKSYCGKMLTF